MGPGQYTSNFKLTEENQFSGAFTKSKNKNFLDHYAHMKKNNQSKAGYYKNEDIEKGYKTSSRPLSTSICSRRRVG